MDLLAKQRATGFRLTVRTKLVTLITALIAVISVFIYVFFPNRLEQRAMAGLVARAESIAEMTAASVSPGLFFEDMGAVAEALKAAQQNGDLVYVAVYDNAGQIFASYNRDGTSPVGADQEDMLYETNVPVVHDNDQIGQLHMGLSLEELKTEVASSRYTVALVSCVIFVVGMIVVFGISTVIIHPLGHMVKVAQQIGRGDLRQRTTVVAQDEIGYLAQSFNRMVDNLESARNELEAINKNLEQRIQDRDSELEEQRTLSMRADRLRSLGEMAAGIAHELNQPLVGVRGLAEHCLIAIDKGWDLSEEKLKERLTGIVEEADRMVHIIQHVRLFAREAGKPELSKVQVNDVVKSSIDLVCVQFRSHNLDITAEMADGLPAVMANPYSLEEVILNLLRNARDAVEDRLGTDGWAEARVVVRTASNGHGVHIQVEDNGVGIGEDVLPNIFDPFFTTKDPDKGTGLGMAISRSIVEDFGGVLQVESTRGSGTTATIDLPAMRQHADSAPAGGNDASG